MPTVDWWKHHDGIPLSLARTCLVLTVEVTVIITFLQAVVLGDAPLFLCGCQGSNIRDTCCASCQSPSRNHKMTRVCPRALGCQHTPLSLRLFIFSPSECTINLDGLCLKGFAYAADTLSEALRLPLSPACLCQTRWCA